MTPVPTPTRRIALVKDMHSVLPKRVSTPVLLPGVWRVTTTNLRPHQASQTKNLETLLEPADREGCYRDGYAGFATLLQALGETTHQSCLVLTGREAPAELAVGGRWRGTHATVFGGLRRALALERKPGTLAELLAMLER